MGRAIRDCPCRRSDNGREQSQGTVTKVQRQRWSAFLITIVTCDLNSPPPSCLEHSDTRESTLTLVGLMGARPSRAPETRGHQRTLLTDRAESLAQRPKFWCTKFLTSVLSNGTLISEKAIQERISRRTKNSSGVSDLWHAGAMWGKKRTLT